MFSTFLAAANLDILALLFLLDLGAPLERLAKARNGFTKRSLFILARPEVVSRRGLVAMRSRPFRGSRTDSSRKDGVDEVVRTAGLMGVTGQPRKRKFMRRDIETPSRGERPSRSMPTVCARHSALSPARYSCRHCRKVVAPLGALLYCD